MAAAPERALGSCRKTKKLFLKSIMVARHPRVIFLFGVDRGVGSITSHEGEEYMRSRVIGSTLGRIGALSIAGAATLAMTQTSKAQNLLLDPSFELQLQSPGPNGGDGIAGWGEFAGAGFSQTHAHTGSWSMYTPDDGGGYVVPGAYQIVPGVAGQNYTMSGWVYTPDTLVSGSNDFAILQISWYQTPTGGAAAGPAGGTTVGVDLGTPAGTPPAGTVALPAGTWTFATVSGVAPTGTEGVGAYLLDIDADANSDFYFDDISLTTTAVPEPATMGLLVLAGLPLLRRRRRS